MNMDLQTAYERIQNSKSPIEEVGTIILETGGQWNPACLLYTSPSPRDLSTSRMPSSA